MAIFNHSTLNWREENAKFWSKVTQFYQTQGMDAWNYCVPHQITNNPDFAHIYAKLVVNYMMDCRHKGYQGSFTIIEPGAGLGKFAFYFIKELLPLLQIARIPTQSFRYILTDTTDQSSTFWREHPQLESYFSLGILETTRLYLDSDLKVHFDLEKISSEDRLILIANYCFDTLYQSPFQCRKGVFEPCKITLKKSSLNHQDESLQFKPLSGVPRPFSNYDHYDRILDEHHSHDVERTLMPDGPIALIQWMDGLTPHPLLVITSDKGFTNFQFDRYAENFNVVDTGTYASCVNFFAIGRYVELALHGSYIFGPSDQSRFGTQIFLTRESTRDYPNFALEAHSCIVSNGTYAQISMRSALSQTVPMDADDLFLFFMTHRFAPHSLTASYEQLDNVLQNSDAFDCIDVDRALRMFLDNYYFTPHENSIYELACIANLALIAKRFPLTKLILDLFVKYHGKIYQYHRLLGNYFFLQSEFSSAAHHFTESLSLNPECKSSQTFLQHCEVLL